MFNKNPVFFPLPYEWSLWDEATSYFGKEELVAVEIGRIKYYDIRDLFISKWSSIYIYLNRKILKLYSFGDRVKSIYLDICSYFPRVEKKLEKIFIDGYDNWISHAKDIKEPIDILFVNDNKDDPMLPTKLLMELYKCKKINTDTIIAIQGIDKNNKQLFNNCAKYLLPVAISEESAAFRATSFDKLEADYKNAKH